MRKRDEATAPAQGDRVAYVMVKGTKDSKGYEKSEEPLYVLQNSLPIDYEYYLHNQIKQPLLRLFEPIYANAETLLLSGEHTRNIYVPKMQGTQGLGRFAVVKKQCLGCKAILQKEKDIICRGCQPKKRSIFIEQKIEQYQLEKAYGDLWVQCQRCQGSLHEDILCTSRDCPIFYRRVKAKKSLEETQERLSGFNDW